MTRWLADRVRLHRGELASIEIRENRRRAVTARVVEIVDEPLFNTVYVELGALDRLLGEPDTYSGMSLAIDASRDRELYTTLKRLPVAASVDLRRAAIGNFRARPRGATSSRGPRPRRAAPAGAGSRLPGRRRDRRVGGNERPARPDHRAVPRSRSMGGVRPGARSRTSGPGGDRGVGWNVDRDHEPPHRGCAGGRAAVRRDP